MPDKKLTDSEIVKALEHCQNQNEYTCDDCPYREENHIDNEGNFEVMSNGLPYDHYSCDVWLQADALGLINRLRAENKRLSTLAELGNTRANDYRVMRDRALKAEAENSNLTSDLTSLKNDLTSANAENERLTIRLRKAEHQLDDAMKMYNTIKTKAYKEFAQKLESIIMWSPKNHIAITAKDVRNILNGLVGE